jgi:hypothetical protein
MAPTLAWSCIRASRRRAVATPWPRTSIRARRPQVGRRRRRIGSWRRSTTVVEAREVVFNKRIPPEIFAFTLPDGRPPKSEADELSIQRVATHEAARLAPFGIRARWDARVLGIICHVLSGKRPTLRGDTSADLDADQLIELAGPRYGCLLTRRVRVKP